MAVTTYLTVDELTEHLTIEFQLTNDGETWPDIDVIQKAIEMAAGRINAALRASDQFTCTKDDDAKAYLKALNLVGAVLLVNFDNVRKMPEEDKARYERWFNEGIEALRSENMIVCEGETGVDHPAFATAQVAYTPEAAFNILINAIKKEI